VPILRPSWLLRLTGPGRYSDAVPGYRLLQQVGVGGFSTVHVAEDLAAGRRVALKLARNRDRGTQERFATEAEIGQRLASARGIVGTLAQTRTRDGRPVLVMPFYDLGNAATLLPDGHRLALPQVVDLVQEVAQGLDAMHRQHYVHRDISPRNVLRSTELGSALGDLGCSRPFNSTRQPPWTEALTPGYAAPEALTPTAVQTIASDVYGLAATTWALFTGLPPYGRPPDPAALELVARYELRRNSQPPPLDALQFAGVPEAAARLLAQALNPDPARRPGRVLDLSDALATAISPAAAPPAPTARSGAGMPGPIQPSSGRRPGTGDPTEVAGEAARPAPAERPRRRRRPLLVLITVLACFVLGFTVVRAVSGPEPAADPKASPTGSPTGGPAGSPAPGSTAQPGDDVAPRDLRIAQQSRSQVTLRWTPPANPDALVVLYRSQAAGTWKPVNVDLLATSGQAEVPVRWSGGRYCFRLVVVVRASRGFTSNSACLRAAGRDSGTSPPGDATGA
jgi:eukaryotic-like serine/threonine-protein kinase